MRSVLFAAAAALLVVSSSAAEAATTRFDFFWSGSNGSWEDEIAMSKDGIDLTIKEEGGGKVRHWQYHGLGAWGGPGDSSHQVDSWGYKEVVGFHFSKMVQIVGIGFSYVNWHDTADIYVDDTAGGPDFEDVPLPNSWYAYLPATNTHISDFFGVGAGWDCHCHTSAFKIKYIDVAHPEVVPLPAAGWLLLGGLGGLAALKRRKRAAA